MALNGTGNIGAANTAIAGVTVSPATTGTLGQLEFTDPFCALQLFDKVGVLVRRLRLVATDLAWLMAHADVYGGLDFTQLPVHSAQPPLRLQPLLSTLLVIKLARLWTAAPASAPVQSLYDLMGSVGGSRDTEVKAQTALATITGWLVADIQAHARALGLSFPTDYRNPAAFDRLRTLQAVAATGGAGDAQIVSWGGLLADEQAAESAAAEALAALKAKQPNNEAWLELAPTLMNPIRERRSAALQAWLIAQRDASGNLVYKDSDGLFDYFSSIHR